MSTILGLPSTEHLASNRFTNYRRSVAYDYPNGKAPLLALLSLPDAEETNDHQFNWFEQRMPQLRTETAINAASKGPWRLGDGTGGGSDIASLTQGTEYWLYVDSVEYFRTGNVIRLPTIKTTASATVNNIVIANVTQVDSTDNKLKVRIVSSTLANVENGSANDNIDVEVLIIGSAYRQGSRSATEETTTLPSELYNYTQIFKTPFSLPRTAMKTELKYDKTGPYKAKAKEHALFHNIEMERAILFGRRYKEVQAGSQQPTTYTGGILWHMEQYELTSSNPYGVAGATADTDDGKRIITNSAGTMDIDTYENYLERLFRKASNTTNQKLCLLGSGAMNVINQMYRKNTNVMTRLPSEETWGMVVKHHEVPFGDVFYKTHPLFSENPLLRFNMLFVDVGYLKYRPLLDSDTQLLKNRQENDADYRKDEFLTEAGFEMMYPEAFMYIQNVTQAVA